MGMNNKSKLQEILSALKYAWIFYSIIVASVLALFYFVPGEFLLHKTPLCTEISVDKSGCPACGMTRDFTGIGNGRIFSADRNNNYSLHVFIIFLINTTFFMFFAAKAISQRKTYKLKTKRNKLWLKQV